MNYNDTTQTAYLKMNMSCLPVEYVRCQVITNSGASYSNRAHFQVEGEIPKMKNNLPISPDIKPPGKKILTYPCPPCKINILYTYRPVNRYTHTYIYTLSIQFNILINTYLHM